MYSLSGVLINLIHYLVAGPTVYKGKVVTMLIPLPSGMFESLYILACNFLKPFGTGYFLD